MLETALRASHLAAAEGPPRVSVVTITYNQEEYVAEALESVLSQQCDFRYEYIIGDDASTDGTIEILRAYQDRYPDRVRLVLRDKNLGAQRNLADLIARCTGQYVALLEGDDFWTSTEKLRKQVDFMDLHPDCALCFTDVNYVQADGRPAEGAPKPVSSQRLDIEDLLSWNFIATCTVMYRWGLVASLPDWWTDTWIGDFPLHVLHAQHGWIGHIPEPMASYRMHGHGLWGSHGAAASLRELITVLRRLDKTLEFRHHAVIQRSIYSYRLADLKVRLTAPSAMDGEEVMPTKADVLWLLQNLRWRGDHPMSEVILVVLRGTCPWLIKPLVRAKKAVRRLTGGRTQDRAS